MNNISVVITMSLRGFSKTSCSFALCQVWVSPSHLHFQENILQIFFTVSVIIPFLTAASKITLKGSYPRDDHWCQKNPKMCYYYFQLNTNVTILYTNCIYSTGTHTMKSCKEEKNPPEWLGTMPLLSELFQFINISLLYIPQPLLQHVHFSPS